jgi:hypothetical protein
LNRKAFAVLGESSAASVLFDFWAWQTAAFQNYPIAYFIIPSIKDKKRDSFIEKQRARQRDLFTLFLPRLQGATAITFGSILGDSDFIKNNRIHFTRNDPNPLIFESRYR